MYNVCRHGLVFVIKKISSLFILYKSGQSFRLLNFLQIFYQKFQAYYYSFRFRNKSAIQEEEQLENVGTGVISFMVQNSTIKYIYSFGYHFVTHKVGVK